MKTILLTGATGFIGKNVIERVIEHAHDYSLIAFVDKNDIRGMSYLNDRGIKSLTIDDFDSYEGNIDFCIHLASYGVAYGARDINLMIDVNIKLTAHIAEFCSKHNCCLFINTGSCFEYGSGYNAPIKENQDLLPEDIYAASKAACEVFLNTYSKILGLKIITVRPFGVYGKYEPAQRLLPLVFNAGINKEPLGLTEGNQIRDYLFASDLADLLLLIIKNNNKTRNCEAINVCSNSPITIKDFVVFVAESCSFDKDLFRFGSLEYRKNEAMYFVGDNKRLIEIVGKVDLKITKEKINESFKSYVKIESHKKW